MVGVEPASPQVHPPVDGDAPAADPSLAKQGVLRLGGNGLEAHHGHGGVPGEAHLPLAFYPDLISLGVLGGEGDLVALAGEGFGGA